MRVYSTWSTPKRGGPRSKPISFHPTTFRPTFTIKDSGLSLSSIRCGDLSNVRKVPRLAHRLDRVLFQPLNYHFLQDPRSSVYNFSPYLQKVVPLKELNQKLLEGTFVPSEKDENLLKLCQEHKTNFYTSTSAVTGILSHMHFLLSNMKGINGDVLSKNFKEKRFRFTKGASIPGVVMAMRKDTEGPDCPFSKRRYAIGADHSADNEIVLSLMGHFMERLLVSPPKVYDQFRADSEVPFEKVKKTFHGDSIYNFSKISNFILRSQLDCQDQRLPNGNKSFDIKTRAVCAVRHDISHVERDEYTGYQIVRAHDQYESFEREFYELMRSTLLKYSLQARIGNMDGIFVAYHNIEKVFGFQYLPLEEIDYILHSDTLESTLNSISDVQDQEKIMGPLGTHTPDLKRLLSSKIANTEYKFSMEIINRILCRILNKREGAGVTLSDNYRIVFKTGKFKKKVYLFVLASPIDEQMVEKIQNVSKEISNTTLDKHIDIEKLLSGDNDSSDSPLSEELLKKNYKSFEHRKLVREINQKTSENAFGYRISVEHLFNGKLSKMAHPMPTSLDDDWALDTYITSVRPSLARFLYLKFLKEKEDICWRSLYDNESESEPDSEVYKEEDICDSNPEARSENDKMELHLKELAKDTEPSQYQQLLRAFGGKGRLREERYRQRPPKHIQLVK